MKCPECDILLPNGSKFCKQCGRKLELNCPECGNSLPPDSNFCFQCGHDLRKPKEPPAIDYRQPRSYTPKHLADKILSNRIAIEGERKLVTILFADVANSTAIFENLDPEQVHEIMDGCFRILMDEIHRYEGTVNQFTGDGVMALFGAPIAHEDHAQRACYASLAIQESLRPYAERLKTEHGIHFTMRAGLNSGSVVVGAIGDDLRMDYTAQGDTSNLAARMESAAEPGSVLVSEYTHKLANGYFDFESLGEIQVKGKTEPIKTYQLVKPSEVTTRIEASTAKGLTRFVGREREFETLKDAFQKIRLGEGQVVGVVGEAGVGKSRLLLEFRNSLPKGEYIYLEGRCLHYGSSMPYLPILDAFRTYLGVKEGEKESVIKQKMKERIVGSDDTLTRCLPPIQELFSIKVDDEGFANLEPKQKREKTFEAIRDILIRGGQTRPIVMAIEDLHWIDKTTEEFLDYMIGWLPGSRIMLILLYRPEYTHQWGSKSYYSKVGVGHLSMNASAELVRAILAGGDVVPELRELILNRAEGNPLFMEELTHGLLQNGSIQRKGDSFVLARDVSTDQVPETIQGIIAARMDRLEESLKRIMQVAAVIGREFAFRILETITETKEELKSGLTNLQGLEFIYEKSLVPDLEYIFRHALVQEVAYNSLLLRRRKEIHEKVGKAIEELYPERLEEFYEILAYHYARSEALDKASQYLKLSGNNATRSNSLWEAYSFYKGALATLGRLPENLDNKKKKLEVLILMLIPMITLSYPAGSLEMLQEGERISKELTDYKRLALFRSRVGHCYTYSGNHLLARKYSEDAFERLRKGHDVDLITPLAWGLCASYWGTGQYDKIFAVATRVINLLEKTGREFDFFALPVNPYSLLCGYCGMSMGYLGNFEEGKIFLEKGLGHATQTGDLRSLGNVELFWGMFFHNRGEWKAAIDHFQNCIEKCEKAKYLVALAWAWAFWGDISSILGEPDTGRMYVETGLRIQRDARFEWFLSFHHYFLGDIWVQLGDLKKGRNFMDEALRLSQKNNEKWMEGFSWLDLGRILGQVETPQIDKAEEYMLQGMKILDELKLAPNSARGYLGLGALYANAGVKEKAEPNLRKAQHMFQEMGMGYWLGKAQEELARL